MIKNIQKFILYNKLEKHTCPDFDIEPWNDKFHEWNDKMFIEDSVYTLFLFKLNIVRVVKRMKKKLEAAGAEMLEWMLLIDKITEWRTKIYILADMVVPWAKNVTITGTFFSKVFEGDPNNLSEWTKEFESEIENRGLNSKKIYVWFTVCPYCAEVRGKNYVVLIAKVS